MVRGGEGAERATQAHRLRLEAALFSTRCVLELTERFVNETGRKLFVILSYGRKNLTDFLSGIPRYDQTLVDWLKARDYPVVDMRDEFKADFDAFKGDVASFVLRYYIGRHNPPGNFFTAWAMRERIYEWLDPKPLPVGEG